MGILISETTGEERERIVADSIGNISGLCDGCSPGVIEGYQDYIDEKGTERNQYGVQCTAHEWDGKTGT